ncbi:MAG: ABC transporter permease [Clostridia bacterium]|nr:ABC transporter permease [Clostridia bacterium]
MIASLLIGAISLATVFLFGCVGEIITEKSGHLNLGIPGIMCVGTAGGCLGASVYMGALNGATPSYPILFLFSSLTTFTFSAAVGAIYAFLTVSLKCNQNITGLAITIFGTGLTQFMMDNVIDRSQLFAASSVLKQGLPFAENLGWFGNVFLSHGVLVYLAIAIAVAASLFLNKTKAGLNLRAIGENPAAADAVGINVTNYKFAAILTGSGIAGFGGYFYIIDYIGGSWENASTIEALGWMSIALVIFTLWRPALSIVGSILFAALYILAAKLPGFVSGITFTFTSVLKLFPYIITIIVLIITSIFGSKNVQPPQALGLPYFREER